jgi:hypothetical protein
MGIQYQKNGMSMSYSCKTAGLTNLGKTESVRLPPESKKF